MQIEESFRDLKCDRYGSAFCYSLTRTAKRLAILLLLHALATWRDVLAEARAARGFPAAVLDEIGDYLGDPDGWVARRSARAATGADGTRGP